LQRTEELQPFTFASARQEGTELELLVQELKQAHRQLQNYADRVQELSVSQERQRMARELHDTLSQGLAGLVLQLEAVDAHLSGDRPGRARTILRQAMGKARGTLSEARQAISNLRQPAERDLVESIRQEAERFTRASGIDCETRIDPSVDVPEAVSETILRAVSEGLTNVARHAHASHASLSLTTSDNGEDLVAEIRDDGIGFDPDGVQAGQYGLVGIRERVRLAGGSCEVRSEPGKGTGIVIRFPLENLP
jgi:NarL family two-component system sensor histidine kinase YdfH